MVAAGTSPVLQGPMQTATDAVPRAVGAVGAARTELPGEVGLVAEADLRFAICDLCTCARGWHQRGLAE